MKTAKPPTDPNKLKVEIRLARLRLAKVERQLKSAREEVRLAKRRRKEAKQAARRARKQAKLAKGEVREAELVLAETVAKLGQANRLRASASRRKKAAPKAAIKTEPGQVETEKPAIAVSRDFEMPTPAPSSPESPGPTKAESGVGEGAVGKTENEMRIQPPSEAGAMT